MQHRVDNDGICILLFAGNMLLNVVGSIGVMTLLQGLAMLASIVASVYVAIDHHKKIKWKKRKDKEDMESPKDRETIEKSQIAEKQKHNDNGGHL